MPRARLFTHSLGELHKLSDSWLPHGRTMNDGMRVPTVQGVCDNREKVNYIHECGNAWPMGISLPITCPPFPWAEILRSWECPLLWVFSLCPPSSAPVPLGFRSPFSSPDTDSFTPLTITVECGLPFPSLKTGWWERLWTARSVDINKRTMITSTLAPYCCWNYYLWGMSNYIDTVTISALTIPQTWSPQTNK